MANRISKSPKLILPHIMSGLVAEFDADDNPIIKVLGEDGKPSTVSLENFEKALVSDKDFADIMIASKASGGGGASRKDLSNNGGAGHRFPMGSDQAPQDLSKMTASDLVAAIDARKAQNA